MEKEEIPREIYPISYPKSKKRVEYYSRTKNTKDDWETPIEFFNLLDNEFHFTLDPCASKENTKCKKFYTIEDNGLIQSWKKETVFVNPPYLNISEWVKKCYDASRNKTTVVVLILPARTDTIYWHEYIMKAQQIWFCKGRVNFLKNGETPKMSPTFPLVIVLFRIRDIYIINPFIKSFYHKPKDIEKYEGS